MAAKDPKTSIQVHESTRHFMDALRAVVLTYDDLILEMAEAHFPPALVKKLEERFRVLRGPTAEEVLRKAGV